jgi:hypothetical protein
VADNVEQKIEVWKYDRQFRLFLSLMVIAIGFWLLVSITNDTIPTLQKSLAIVGCASIIIFGLQRIPSKDKKTN